MLKIERIDYCEPNCDSTLCEVCNIKKHYGWVEIIDEDRNRLLIYFCKDNKCLEYLKLKYC